MAVVFMPPTRNSMFVPLNTPQAEIINKLKKGKVYRGIIFSSMTFILPLLFRLNVSNVSGENNSWIIVTTISILIILFLTYISYQQNPQYRTIKTEDNYLEIIPQPKAEDILIVTIMLILTVGSITFASLIR